MDKFTIHKGVGAPLIRDNIDTDAIIPSREMRSVSKTGLSDGLFAAWRYINESERTPDPSFILNQELYKSASILLGGNNFGCGSSREHAVWALKEYGFRCVIAPSFGAIFYRNCVANGILPIRLSTEYIQLLLKHSELEIDLEKQTVTSLNQSISFVIDEHAKQVLLNGLDPISETQAMQKEIDGFSQSDKQFRPWLYND